MAVQPWREGRVVNILEEAPQTNRFFIEIPELEKFDFIPGQFVTLDLPIGERNSERWRSYSIASAPNGTNQFELVIVKAVGGKGTAFIFENWTEGSSVQLRGPQGKFILPETLDKELFLICTGTGIAPFRSMVQFIHQHKKPHFNIKLIFGCRKKEDLLYYEELRTLEKQMPSFSFHPTLSREKWENADLGYVHEVYKSLLKTKPDAAFFLCGWKNMIEDARKNLESLGYSKKDIHFELYG